MTTDQLKEIDERRDTLVKEAEDLLARASGSLTGDDKTRFDVITHELDQLQEHQRQIGLISRYATDSRYVERGSEPDSDPIGDPRSIRDHRRGANPWETRGGFFGSQQESATELRTRALDAIEQTPGASDKAREALTEVLERFDDREGNLARQIILTSAPVYMRAFSQLVQGEQVLTPEESAAVRRVRDLQRAMSLTDSAGGFLVPPQLDPTITITGAGSINPLRQISRTVVATSDTWQGVTAAQISASWDAEAAEVSDDSPTLVQPSISIHMERVFIPFSIEVGMDAQGNFTEELVKMMADAKENLEATAFITGSGTGEPFGIVTALPAGSTVNSATTDTFAIADVYATYEALPVRWRHRASWLANELIYNDIRQFGTSDSHALWARLGDGLPELLLDKARYTASEMDGTINAGADNKVLIAGDFSNYVIADRLGFTVEPIQQLFGANGRPKGQRGLFGYSRVGADSVVDDAFRLLNVT